MDMTHSDGDVVVFWDPAGEGKSVLSNGTTVGMSTTPGQLSCQEELTSKEGNSGFVFVLFAFICLQFGGFAVVFLLGLGGLLLYWGFGLFFEKELNVEWVWRRR